MCVEQRCCTIRFAAQVPPLWTCFSCSESGLWSSLRFGYLTVIIPIVCRVLHPIGLQSRFDDPLWNDVQNLNRYVVEVIYSLIRLNAQSPIDQANANERTTSVFIGSFITAVVLCNLAYYPRVIHSLNKSIKGSRALLLLLPEDVITSVKVLKDTMTAFTKALTAVQ